MAIPAGAQTDHRFVLLKSGKIVEGSTQKQGRKTRIALAQGGYIVLPTEKVDKGFRSRTDIINYKLAVTPYKTRAQDQLLFWLLEQNAYEQASEQLTDLQKYKEELIGFDFVQWQETIRLRMTKKNKISEPLLTATNGKTFFVSKVQPHLLVGCAISGCHRSDISSKYQLHDNTQGTLTDQTRENYDRTLAAIERLGAQEFLKKIANAHGPLKRPMYSKATREYLAIATWVNSQKTDASLSTTKDLAATDSTKASLGTNSKPIASVPTIPRTSIPGRKVNSLGGSIPTGIPSQVANMNNAAGKSAHNAIDEFDPEIFNQLQIQKRQSRMPRPKAITKQQKVTQTPQRLISPDRTNSRN